MTRALLIMGPTASGKSALALALAERLGGEIVNADSMQVYAGLRVLTARPSPEDEARAPHHLYGHVDPAERYSVGRWLSEALTAIADVSARGKTPILVGGTGLYFTALTRGLAEIPAVDPEIADDLAQRLQRDGSAALHAVLASRDPAAAARIQPADAQRILRALGVVETTGAPLSSWQAETKPALAPGAWRGLVIDPGANRAMLREAIARRVDAMLAAGALEEVRALAARNLPRDLPAMNALGVPQLLEHLEGRADLASARTALVTQTGQYAKRQETWARNQFRDGWARAPYPIPPAIAAEFG